MSWLAPPSTLTLRPDIVHIWRVSLDLPAAQRQQLRPLLSADEQDRVGRFYFDKDRFAYIAARGTLRALLGRYLNRPPADLRFIYTEYGKPELDLTQNPGQLRFNLSHSGRIALIAFTLQHDIGVDVEQWRPDVATDEMSKFTFSAREYQTWLALPAARQTEGFFTCWTRKESFLKAHGMGLSLDLKTFDIELHPDRPAALHAFRPNPAEENEWALADIPIDEGYSAAVTVKHTNWQLHLWQTN